MRLEAKKYLFDVREAAESPIPLTRTSLAGFVSAKIVVEAIRRAGPNVTSAGVFKALREPRPYEVGGMTLDFSRAEDHRLAYTRLDIISSRQ